MIRTALAGHELADVVGEGAVYVRVERRKPGDSDVLSEKVKFGDSVPDIPLGRELRRKGQMRLGSSARSKNIPCPQS